MTGTILVTGGNGFVGKAVCRSLVSCGLSVRACRRIKPIVMPDLRSVSWVETGDITGSTSWQRHLEGVTGVVHLANLAHSPSASEADYVRTNVEGTRQLIAECERAQISRFIYVSSVKVMGDVPASYDMPLSEDLPMSPSDSYGRSKADAETIVAASSLDTVIVRPPLVYGPGVRANFLSLLRAVRSGLPMPFGSIRNARSLVFVDNLAAAIHASLVRPAAAKQIFFVRDEIDFSTPDLVHRIARAMGRRPRLVPCPVSLLRAAGHLMAKDALVERLVGSLTISDQRIRSRLDWTPPISPEAAFAMTVKWYSEQVSGGFS